MLKSVLVRHMHLWNRPIYSVFFSFLIPPAILCQLYAFCCKDVPILSYMIYHTNLLHPTFRYIFIICLTLIGHFIHLITYAMPVLIVECFIFQSFFLLGAKYIKSWRSLDLLLKIRVSCNICKCFGFVVTSHLHSEM